MFVLCLLLAISASLTFVKVKVSRYCGDCGLKFVTITYQMMLNDDKAYVIQSWAEVHDNNC